MPYPQPPPPIGLIKLLMIREHKADCGLDGFLRPDKSQNLRIG